MALFRILHLSDLHLSAKVRKPKRFNRRWAQLTQRTGTPEILYNLPSHTDLRSFVPNNPPIVLVPICIRALIILSAT